MLEKELEATNMLSLSVLCAVIVSESVTATNTAQWTAGQMVLCRHLKKQQNANLHRIAKAMNNSFAVIMDPAMNQRGQINIASLDDETLRVAVKPKYLKRIPRLCVHNMVHSKQSAVHLRLLWDEIRSDPTNHVLVFLFPVTSWMKLETNTPNLVYTDTDLPYLSCFAAEFLSLKTERIHRRLFMFKIICSLFCVVPPDVLESVHSKMDRTTKSKQLLSTMRFAFEQYKGLCLRAPDVHSIDIDAFNDRFAKIVNPILDRMHFEKRHKNEIFWESFLSEMHKTAKKNMHSSPSRDAPIGDVAALIALKHWMDIAGDLDGRCHSDLHVINTVDFQFFSDGNLKRLSKRIQQRNRKLIPRLIDDALETETYSPSHRKRVGSQSRIWNILKSNGCLNWSVILVFVNSFFLYLAAAL